MKLAPYIEKDQTGLYEKINDDYILAHKNLVTHSWSVNVLFFLVHILFACIVINYVSRFSNIDGLLDNICSVYLRFKNTGNSWRALFDELDILVFPFLPESKIISDTLRYTKNLRINKLLSCLQIYLSIFYFLNLFLFAFLILNSATFQIFLSIINLIATFLLQKNTIKNIKEY